MTTLIDLNFNDGTMNAFTGTTNPGGDMSASVAAALAGSAAGLQFVINDTGLLEGHKSLASGDTSGILECRYYLDPNSLTMAANDTFFNLFLYNATVAVAQMDINYSSGYRVRVQMFNDAGGTSSAGFFAITDAPHCVEFKLVRATDNTASDGNLEIWIDGVSKGTITGVDNYDRFNQFKTVYMAANLLDAGTSGTFFMDELIINNTGDYIGPVASGPDELTSAGITTGSPTLATSTIGQTHVLTSVAITTGAPTLATSTIGQKHVLTSADITTGAASLGQSTIAQIHALTTNRIVTGAALLAAATIAQIHTLLSSAILAGIPVLDAPSQIAAYEVGTVPVILAQAIKTIHADTLLTISAQPNKTIYA